MSPLFSDIDYAEFHVLTQRLGRLWISRSRFDEYEPHVTIAYGKAGGRRQYVGNQTTAGHAFVIIEAVIRPASK